VQGDGTVLFNGTTGAAGAFDVTGFAALDHLSFDTETVTAMPTGPAGPTGATGATGGNATVPMDTWHSVGAAGEPAFTNSWVNYGDARIARFRKDPLGKVHVNGLIKSGTIGATAFKLPAGYWPMAELGFATPANGTYGQVAVLPDGSVVPNGGSNAYHFLDEITFDTGTVTAMPTGPTGATGAIGGQGLTRLIGDGTSTSFTFAHNFNQVNVNVVVYRTASPYDEIDCDIEHTDANTVTVRTFPTVPAGNEYTVAVSAAGTNTLAAVTMDVWHTVGAAGEPAFQNSWVAHASLGKPRFRKYPDGRVRIAGALAKSTTPASGEVTFTLPAGYRPTAQQIYNVRLWIAGGAEAVGRLDINADGTAVYQAGATAPGVGWLMLDGLEFDTETVLQTASVAAVPMDAWHTIGGGGEPAFTNGWVNYSASEPDAGFRKYPDGRVRLKGIVKNGTVGANTPFFTLPAGYRPPTGARRYVVHSLTNYAEVEINTSGNVYATTGSNGFIDLSPIEFDTETVSAYVSGTIGPSKVTTLPANPVDGQEVYYVADAANGVLWRLCYNAASASVSKWEFVGGPELVAGTDGGGANTTLGAAYTETLLTNPGIVLPLRGDYDLRCLLGGFMSGTTAADFRVLPSNSGGTLPPGVVYASGFTGVQANYGFERTAAPRLLGCPAGNRVQIGVASSTGSLGFVTYARWLWVRPVRVG
jgi:hypothetical protein